MNKILSIVLMFSLLVSGICQQCVKVKAKESEFESKSLKLSPFLSLFSA